MAAPIFSDPVRDALARGYDSSMVRAAPASTDTSRSVTVPRTLRLASRSLRRRGLLEQAGIPHFAGDPGIDDGVLRFDGGTPEQWVASLAYLKARAGSDLSTDSEVVLGADTVCIVDDRVLGQPRDAADAAAMLRSYENRAHRVVTGVALIYRDGPGGPSKREIFADGATVRLGTLGPERIDAYIESGKWRSKAGAYNLEERLLAGWPIEFDGDPTTIVGLPMKRLIPRLRRLGVGVPAVGGPDR
jgi:septum formation protein